MAPAIDELGARRGSNPATRKAWELIAMLPWPSRCHAWQVGVSGGGCLVIREIR
jgi:hypothetical protein